MKKINLIFVVMLWAGLEKITAQSRAELLIAGEIAKPTLQLSENFNFGSGISLKFRYHFDEKFFAQVSSGYLAFRGKKKVLAFDSKMETAFLKAGGGYKFLDIMYSELSIGPVFQNGGLGTSFAISPNVGVQFNLGKNYYGDIALKYENWFGHTTMNFFSISFGIGI